MPTLDLKTYKITGEIDQEKQFLFHKNEVVPRIKRNLPFPDLKDTRYSRSSGKESVLNDKEGPTWVMPYLPNYLEIQKENDNKSKEYWSKYFEFVIIGSDAFKLRECGVLNNIKTREFLDKNIGKLHNK